MVAPAPVLAAPADARPLALLALLAGAIAMGISPVFVRFAEIGPFASAFWRIALALPALWLWSALERAPAPPAAEPPAEAPAPAAPAHLAVLLAGLFFAGDLSFWHLAIMNTSVANATFLATLAPVWVVLGSGLFIGEHVERKLFVGLALCLAGAAALIGNSWTASPQHLFGDLCGLATSVFFGAYFLAVRRARRAYGAGRTLLYSSLVTAVLLLAEALVLESDMWPAAGTAMAALFALALVSHAGGQGLLAFALGHLPAAFSALVIFLEAVAAACFGWLLLGEALGPVQALGAAAIFGGIAIARPRRGSA